MNEISFAEFTRGTRHQKVKYVLTYKKNGQVKEYESDKFYCNKDNRLKMLCLPSILLSMENVFYRIAENVFKAVSSYSETVFTVQEGSE